MPSAVQVAVVDTDSGFVRVLVNRLDAAGLSHRVFPGPVGADGVGAVGAEVVVLDPVTLGHEASAFLRRLIEIAPNTGLLVCTGPSSVGQRVRGLRAGVDAWMTKPCHADEVVARAEAIIRRRRRAEPAGAVTTIGDVELHPAQLQARVGGRGLDLTRREFELLHFLAERQGEVVSREKVYEAVWGYALAHGDRSVDVFIRKLRIKLEQASPGWRYLHTHFGVGYRLQPERVEEASAG